MRYAHTNIVSLDWKMLADFYIKTFDCKIKLPLRKQAGDWLDKGIGLKKAKLEGVHLLLPGHGKNGPTLEIYQYSNILNQDKIGPNTRGFAHIAFEVENVEDILEKVLNNGGHVQGELVSRNIEGIWEINFVYARDPEGNLIELQSWKKT